MKRNAIVLALLFVVSVVMFSGCSNPQPPPVDAATKAQIKKNKDEGN